MNQNTYSPDKALHPIRERSLVLLIPALFAFFLLANTLTYGFMSDDYVLVHRVHNQGYFTSWGGEDGYLFFRPVTVLSYLTDHLIWGLRPTGYHLTNIIWHILCSALVFLLAKELLRNTHAALCSGFLFLLLSCHSESVSWISGRTDLIATTLCLLSLLLFLKGSWWSIFTFLAGLLAKESIVIAPLLWTAFLVLPVKRCRKHLLIIACGLLTATVYATLRFVFAEQLISGLNSAGIRSLNLPDLAENIFRYSFRVFVPPLPGGLRATAVEFPIMIPAISILLAIALLFAFGKKVLKEKTFPILVGCFIISIIPVIFMKVSFFDTQSERFLYLPSVFAVIGLVQLVFSRVSQKKALAIILLFGCLQGVFLYRSNMNWKIAGEMCVAIVSNASRGGDQISEPPDNHNGAYVFRNGLNEAVSLFQESR